MRNPIPFDTHAYVKRLVAAGVPEAQAEIHAQVFVEAVIEHLATKEDLTRLAKTEDVTLLKQDLLLLKQDLRAETQELRGEIRKVELGLRGEIREVELRLNQRLTELENRLTVRMGVLLAAGIGIVATLVKLL